MPTISLYRAERTIASSFSRYSLKTTSWPRPRAFPDQRARGRSLQIGRSRANQQVAERSARCRPSPPVRRCACRSAMARPAHDQRDPNGRLVETVLLEPAMLARACNRCRPGTRPGCCGPVSRLVECLGSAGRSANRRTRATCSRPPGFPGCRRRVRARRSPAVPRGRDPRSAGPRTARAGTVRATRPGNGTGVRLVEADDQRERPLVACCFEILDRAIDEVRRLHRVGRQAHRPALGVEPDRGRIDERPPGPAMIAAPRADALECSASRACRSAVSNPWCDGPLKCILPMAAVR